MQLGPDGSVRVDDVAPWQEQLLDALTEGIPDAMLLPLARTLGANEADAARFVATIGGALAPAPATALPAQAEIPADISFAEADALAHGLRAGGLDAVSMTRWRHDAPDPALPMILVADRLVEPRRAGALLAADITHLPIELAGDRAVVGPLVVPGVTGCLTCLHAHRTDADEKLASRGRATHRTGARAHRRRARARGGGARGATAARGIHRRRLRDGAVGDPQLRGRAARVARAPPARRLPVPIS